MKILMIAPQPIFEPRGTPISVRQRLEMLSLLGFKVDLVTYHIGEDVSIENVQVHRIPNVSFIKQISIGPSWGKVILDLLLFLKVVQLMLHQKYALLHSHEEASFFCAFLAVIFRTPHLYDMHSSLPRQFAHSKYGKFRPVVRLFERLEQYVLSTCQGVLTVDADLSEYVTQNAPHVVHSRIENLPVQSAFGTSTRATTTEIYERLNLPEWCLPIVYTGTFETYQGLDLLIHAAKTVCHQAPEALFILVGGTTDQVNKYRCLADKLNLGKRFIFTGTVSIQDSIQYMDLAEILVSPRINGTAIPLKVYSYLQAGKAIVATNIPSHTQVFDSDTSLLVESTPSTIAAGILHLIRSPSYRQKIAQNAAQLAEQKYTIKAQALKLDHVYQALLHSHALNQVTKRPSVVSALGRNIRNLNVW